MHACRGTGRVLSAMHALYAGHVCRSPAIGGHGTQIKSPLIGMVNVYNILAAVAVGIATGINLKVVLLHVSATHFLFPRCFTHSRPKMMM